MEPCLENSIGFWVAVSADAVACTTGKQIDPPATVLPTIAAHASRPELHELSQPECQKMSAPLIVSIPIALAVKRLRAASRPA
jgi:hypothetical protein